MEVKKIKELIELMKENDLNELEVSDGDSRILLKRGAPERGQTNVVAVPQIVSAGPVEPARAVGAPSDQPTPSEQSDRLVEISSPLVGTFYSAPSPNADDFLREGQAVDVDSVVCIIEAMKVMNEVKSEVKGTVKKILVKNGQAVEYGQALFLVDPEP